MQEAIRLLNGVSMSKENFDKSINRYKVYTDINLVVIGDTYCFKLLILFQHLKNMDNMEVALSFLAKHLGCNEKTIRRNLNKLKELQLITWESGKANRKMNKYTFNQEKYDVFIATLNSLQLDKRVEFAKKFFNTQTDNMPKCEKEAKINVVQQDVGEKINNISILPSYSELDKEKQKEVDNEIIEIIIRTLCIRDKTKENQNIKTECIHFKKALENGSKICGDFEEKIQDKIKQKSTTDVLEAFNSIIKDKTYLQ